MRYGHFDDAAGEYVITRPDTPMPWTNYLGGAEFGAVVTNHGGGYTFYRSAAQGRLSRYRFNAPPSGNPGKYVYLVDLDRPDPWAVGWMPAPKPLDRFDYRCRFGPGYAVVSSVYNAVEAEAAYFIPPGRLFEVWRVRVRNCADTPRRLRAFPFLEPQCNWHAGDDATNRQYVQYIAQTRFEDGMLDISSNANMPPDPDHFENKDQPRHTFMALAGVAPSGFDGDLAGFLGVYGAYAAPAAVVAGRCSGGLAYGDDPCAVLQVDLDLAPGEERTFAVLFGVGEAAREGAAARAALSKPGAVDAAFEEARGHGRGRLRRALRVKTPDPAFDAMANVWAPYNNLMTFYWSRAASLVYAGERDGLGFRDTLQDIVGAAALVPEEAGSRLELMLTGQLANGGAMSVVKPFAHRPGREKEPSSYRSDDALWFFNAVPRYVKETGDLDFLRKRLPYADRGDADVLGHLRRALEFSLERLGAHGLPCGLAADWNDCLRFGEKGESTFVAFQLRHGLVQYAELAERLDEPGGADWARAHLATLDDNLERHAWDGEWYLRGYRFDGFKFGSRESAEGRIFVNPQTWAVLSGHATGDRARRILDAVRRDLATDRGVMLCAPPYVETDPSVALARLFNPGTKENAGIFNHVQGWAVMAEAECGRPEAAWDYLRASLPAYHNDRAELRQVEPYAVCQSLHSKYSPRFGTGRLPWLSGSAVWNYFAMTHALLGLRPHYDGFEIKPCLPADWPGYAAERTFRGRRLRIRVEHRPDEAGPTEARLNGKVVESGLLPVGALKEDNEVEVIARR